MSKKNEKRRIDNSDIFTSENMENMSLGSHMLFHVKKSTSGLFLQQNTHIYVINIFILISKIK